MVSFTLFGTLASLTLTANCLTIPQKSQNVARDGLKVLAVPISANRSSQHYQKRGDVTTEIVNAFWIYTMDLEVGSNKQKVTLEVDTGSSDMWVIGKGAQCSNPSCTDLGVYDNSASTTSKSLNLPYLDHYLDGSSTSGTYFTDDVTIPGGVTLNNFQFADCNQTSLAHAIVGLGLITEEARYYYDLPGVTDYPNMPYQLKKQGVIGKAAYSLYLNSPNANSGNILFGGIDHAKYQGPLTTRNGFDSKRIGITVDNAQIDGQTYQIGGPTIFDSGFTFSSVPQAVHDAVQKKLQNPDGSITCPPSGDLTMTFGIGETQLEVPLSSFIYSSDGKCQLTLSVSDSNNFDNLPTFGDDVLRHAYVVYDLEDNTVGVAQAQYSDATNITEI